MNSPIHFSGFALVLWLFLGCTVAPADDELPGEDRKLLRAGDLAGLLHQYESSNQTLGRAQRAVLCEIYIRQLAVSDAQACLDMLATGADQELQDTVAGKRALLNYLIADYRESAALSNGLKSLGGRYVNALARLRLGEREGAEQLASLYGRDYAPEKVFLAANLYFALEEYDQVLETLRRPPLLMHLNYSLSGNVTVTGDRALEAPLRVDLFDEFRYGLLDSMSLAPPSNIYVEYLLAVSEKHAGQSASAAKRIERVLAYPGIDAYRELKWRAVAERAGLELAAGDAAAALGDYKAAVAGFDSVRSSIATDAGRVGFSGDKGQIYAAPVRLLLAQGKAQEAFEYSEQFRSRALVDLLASVSRFGPRGGLSGEAQARELATVSRSEVSPPAIDANLSGPGASSEQRTAAANRKRAYLADRDQALGRLDREVREYVEVQRTPWSQVAASLEKDELLLSYYSDGESWWAFAVNREGVKPVPLGQLKPTERVNKMRRAIEAGGADDGAAASLYAELVAPVVSALDGKLPPKVTIVPHGILHYLPFAALREGDGGKYFIQRENLALAMLPAARIRPYLRAGGGRETSMLVLADPDRTGAPRLPWAQEELSLAESGVDERLTDKNATREEFLARAPHHDILHIAAHGNFNEANPIDSSILLAPDAERGDLNTTELFKVAPPWRARLVVLSACQSSLNETSYGEEVIGLHRGLLFAGAGSIVGSLWEIEDRGTYEFMQDFYSKMREPRETIAGALAATQRQQIEERVDPKIWAAFTYTGIHD